MKIGVESFVTYLGVPTAKKHITLRAKFPLIPRCFSCSTQNQAPGRSQALLFKVEGRVHHHLLLAKLQVCMVSSYSSQPAWQRNSSSKFWASYHHCASQVSQSEIASAAVLTTSSSVGLQEAGSRKLQTGDCCRSNFDFALILNMVFSTSVTPNNFVWQGRVYLLFFLRSEPSTTWPWSTSACVDCASSWNVCGILNLAAVSHPCPPMPPHAPLRADWLMINQDQHDGFVVAGYKDGRNGMSYSRCTQTWWSDRPDPEMFRSGTIVGMM